MQQEQVAEHRGLESEHRQGWGCPPSSPVPSCVPSLSQFFPQTGHFCFRPLMAAAEEHESSQSPFRAEKKLAGTDTGQFQQKLNASPLGTCSARTLWVVPKSLMIITKQDLGAVHCTKCGSPPPRPFSNVSDMQLSGGLPSPPSSRPAGRWLPPAHGHGSLLPTLTGRWGSSFPLLLIARALIRDTK